MFLLNTFKWGTYAGMIGDIDVLSTGLKEPPIAFCGDFQKNAIMSLTSSKP